jgi:primosomal protein N''
MDVATEAKIRRNPALIDKARQNLERWRRQNGAHQEWERVLRFLTPDQVADFLVGRAPIAARLSQSSPFARVLAEEGRL